MRNTSHSVSTRFAVSCVVAMGLGVPGVAAADDNDWITTAGVAATTAYFVGKEVAEDDYARAEDFAETRAVAIRRDAAMGGGRNVEALAVLLGEDNPRAFGQWMQAHYAELYQDPATDDSLVKRIVAMRSPA